jgi:quercetin dioxygenase-like cupin family protein
MQTLNCDNLDRAISEYLDLGYRLDMITPADSPREVQLSKNHETLRLVLSRKLGQETSKDGTHNGWITGRTGMMYRDLIPDRLGGELIASHIRLTEGGPVPDYVHYHKIDFQLIYCLRGRIKVVYEDQGPPFWLEPGDCVLQPPEIRHRVLECEAGSEVLELTSPAKHETWVEHEMTLPNSTVVPGRQYSGQRFVRNAAKDAQWYRSESDGIEERDLGIYKATNGLIDVRIRRTDKLETMTAFSPPPGMTAIGFVVAGKEKESIDPRSTVVPLGRTPENALTEILRLEFRGAAAGF